MSRLAPASIVRTGDGFRVDGGEHVVARIADNGALLWVTTDEGRLVPVHKTERVLITNEPDVARASSHSG